MSATFAKSFKIPDPIPEKGIQQAAVLMRKGRLYRYNFSENFASTPHSSGSSIPKDWDEDDQIATEVANFEYEFSRYIGIPYVVAVNSCGSALFIALKALGIEHGDEVLTNAFTFTAVPSSIVHAGGKPVYVECSSNYVIDIEDFKLKVASHPEAKVFIVSHMRGHISDLDSIKEICEQSGIKLVEDCAHSLGAKWNDQPVGCHGQISCFSTQSYKLLNSGEGGLIATSDDTLAAYCILAAGSYEKLYKKHIARPFEDDLFEELKPHVPNFSLRMNNLTAAVLRPQLEFTDQKVTDNLQRYEQLARIINSVRNIHVPTSLPQVQRAPDSLQFNLLGLTEEQVNQFILETGKRGVTIQVFGKADNSRYYKNWQYSFEDLPSLEKTKAVLVSACDIRLPSSFNSDDLNLIGYIIKDVLYKILSENNPQDYPSGLSTFFETTEEVKEKYDTWADFYDKEHYDNGWTILLNHVAYTLVPYLQDGAEILDIGCGTGLLGRELISYGFQNLHGVDISQQSLNNLEKLNLYQGLHLEELGKTLSFDSDQFDLLISTGVFTRNQVPLESFEELSRILKPGGFFAVVLRIEDNDFYYKPIQTYCKMGDWKEVLKSKISVLQSCNHELVVVQKC
ncbi:MAG: aminotransferase class I/II-fold pyridoxal phosphate-dependent enzyme [Cyanothece sp. SIO2G6]|nr:aminotransferase class I/II-fold pyridoxal phosphate-dependent enzyme [Cyanothece sp. SIO2G6]